MLPLLNSYKYLSLILIISLFSIGLLSEKTLARHKNKHVIIKKENKNKHVSYKKESKREKKSTKPKSYLKKNHHRAERYKRRAHRHLSYRATNRHQHKHALREASNTTFKPKLTSKPTPRVQIPTDRASEIQQALKRTGYYLGEITGEYDNETRLAMISFQRANGLKETGTPTAQSLAKLGLTFSHSNRETPQVQPVPTPQEDPDEN